MNNSLILFFDAFVIITRLCQSLLCNKVSLFRSNSSTEATPADDTIQLLQDQVSFENYFEETIFPKISVNF